MKKKRIVSLLLVCVMMLSLLPTNIVIAATPSEIFAASSGDGSTEAEAYIIESAEQLRAFSKSVTDGDGNDYSGKYIKLLADIDLGGDESNQWTPIGNSTERFNGIFDGNNKKITGLYINNSLEYQGLFGYANENATIKTSVYPEI